MKNCKQCNISFEITDTDRQFYEKMDVPEPTFCLDCRLQRRIVWRNERFLYTGNCDKCKKGVITIHKDPSFPIYCNKCWWGDEFDARKYGQDFDFKRPFFEQFAELRNAVPQIAIMNDNGVASVNCEYCQDFAFGKNCYFLTGSWHTENSFYCTEGADYSKYICDCIFIQNSELVYSGMDSQNLYNSAFIQNSENCSDCFFGFDLKGCKNCLFSYNLRNKQYYVFNKECTKEEYEKKYEEIFNGSYTVLRNALKIWLDHLIKNAIFRSTYQTNCEDSVGNQLFDCKDVHGFNVYNGEHCRFYHRGASPIWCYDVFNSGNGQWCYEGNVPDNSYMALFTLWCWKCKNVFYSDNCHSCEDLFGCISLRREKHCVLNKQYSKEEYEELVPKIIEHMKSTGEWGEYFPINLSSYGYNETVAQEYFPLTKEQVLKKGWKWRDEDKNNYKKQTFELPDKLSDTPDSVIKEIIACTDCGKNYKIQLAELDFYKKMNLPIPRQCPNCRHNWRLGQRPPYKLWDSKCFKCQSDIKTTYSSDRPEKVYCESCYLKEVY